MIAKGTPVDENRAKMQVDLDTLRRQRSEILSLARKRGGRNVRIFGSVVRGESRPDSDIDFLVEFDPGRTLFDLIGLKLDLQDLLGTAVDVVTPNSLRYVRERVMAEARAL